MSTRTVLGAVGAVIGGWVTGLSAQGMQWGWSLPAKIEGAQPASVVETTAEVIDESGNRVCDKRTSTGRG